MKRIPAKEAAILLAAGAALLLHCTCSTADALREPLSAGIVFFENRIRPVLVEHCYQCHSAESKTPKGGLRLDSAAGVRRGGGSGPVVVAGRPDESPLLSALRYQSLQMPPSGKLPDHLVADFERWIAAGAPDPREEEPPLTSPLAVNADPRAHWAFQPLRQVVVPHVDNSAWNENEIDAFVFCRLEQAGLAPSPEATPRALLRRVYYDLTGLPPTAEELKQFQNNFSEAEYESVIERLLASPRFGERWARHWLDVARYADTKGYLFEEDRSYPHAYKFRDWVIQSFNADRPYDEFIVAQIAADQLDDKSLAPAMGFLTLGRRFLNNQHDIIDDRIDLVTRGLMGLTVSCARCHDHKYDPIPTADYYSLYGVFASSNEKVSEDGPPILVDAEQLVDPVVFLRGSPSNRGPQTPRRFLTCVAAATEQSPFKNGSGRLEMARAIARRDNPLTARVWVNRIWEHLFGRGLVATPSDFGLRGDPPTHPELLDWLACQFMDEGWSTKTLIRQIVLSRTYRQATTIRSDAAEIDPENRLWWRTECRRLDLESTHDSLLMAAGRLDLTMGGPSVKLTEQPFPARRAVYGYIERQNLPAYFRTFDFANPDTHTPSRPETVTPQQAIYFMNSPFVIEQACALAKRATATGEKERIGQLFRFALGRDPEDREMMETLAFLENEQPADVARDAEAPLPLDNWQLVAQALLMSNEFLFVD